MIYKIYRSMISYTKMTFVVSFIINMLLIVIDGSCSIMRVHARTASKGSRHESAMGRPPA